MKRLVCLAVAASLLLSAAPAIAAEPGDDLVAAATFNKVGDENYSPWINHLTVRLQVYQSDEGIVTGSMVYLWADNAYPEPPYMGEPPATSYEARLEMSVTCYVREGNQALIGLTITDSLWEDDVWIGRSVLFAMQDGPDRSTPIYNQGFQPADCVNGLAPLGVDLAGFLAGYGGPVDHGWIRLY